MKLVTGKTDSAESPKKVSIQLSLDGHSFSALPGDFPGEDSVRVELLTPKTMLVPEELFDCDHAGELLAAGGMAPDADECAVSGEPQGGVVALMAWPAEDVRRIRQTLGSRVRFATPLLDMPALTEAGVWADLVSGLLYIKVFGDRLRMAEVIPAASEADVLYLFERLNAEFPLAEQVLYLTQRAKPLRKSIGKRFKRIVSCE